MQQSTVAYLILAFECIKGDSQEECQQDVLSNDHPHQPKGTGCIASGPDNRVHLCLEVFQVKGLQAKQKMTS